MTDTRRKQQGLSLIELMVAMAISMFLMLGVGTIFMGSKRTSEFNDANAVLQENARYAMLFLRRDAALAGFTDHPDLVDNSLPLPPFGDTTVSPEVEVHAEVTTPPADTEGDVLVLQFESATDCNGDAALADPETGEPIAVNRYRVRSNADDDRELVCQGNGGGGEQILLSGVEHMEVLYGVDTDSGDGDGAANIYVPSGAIPVSGYGWDRVTSIRVAMLVSSDKELSQIDADTETYKLLDNASVTVPAERDRMMRRVAVSTLLLRNRIKE